MLGWRRERVLHFGSEWETIHTMLLKKYGKLYLVSQLFPKTLVSPILQ